MLREQRTERLTENCPSHVEKPQQESGSAEIAGEMAREAASKATASRGSGAEAEAEAAAGEYWSEALKSFLDHIPVSAVPGALQPTASPGITQLLPLPSCIGRRRDGRSIPFPIPDH
jgi:hypothetical protein